MTGSSHCNFSNESVSKVYANCHISSRWIVHKCTPGGWGFCSYRVAYVDMRSNVGVNKHHVPIAVAMHFQTLVLQYYFFGVPNYGAFHCCYRGLTSPLGISQNDDATGAERGIACVIRKHTDTNVGHALSAVWTR